MGIIKSKFGYLAVDGVETYQEVRIPVRFGVGATLLSPLVK